VNESHAAQVHGGRETDDIANDAAAYGNNYRATVSACANEFACDSLDRREPLCPLAIVKKDWIWRAGNQFRESAAPVTPDIRRRDHKCTGGIGKLSKERSGARERTFAAVDCVGTRGTPYTNREHERARKM
jgi:hypothetical protein